VSSQIIKPMMWTDIIRPTEEEMKWLLRQYIGADQWRIPRCKWHELYVFNRGLFGELNRWQNFKTWKRQRGIIMATAAYQQALAAQPALSNISHVQTKVAPAPARIQIAYDSDGSMEHFLGGLLGDIVYTKLTTQTDDANDHTNEWWPDQPDINEGLNWDIRTTNETIDEIHGQADFWRFEDATPAERLVDIWYLLDRVSNDHADGSRSGALTCLHRGGTSKNPNPGICTYIGTIEIRATGSGGAVASHVVDLKSETIL